MVLHTSHKYYWYLEGLLITSKENQKYTIYLGKPLKGITMIRHDYKA